MRRSKRELAASDPIRLLADAFVRWQNPWGKLDPKRCPLAQPERCVSYGFIAIALYRAYRATGIAAYKAAADRFALYCIAWLPEPFHAYSAHYGLGLTAFGAFKQHNPETPLLDGRAAAVFRFLEAFRWEKGTYYRNGHAEGGMEDMASSTDTGHTGRGLMAYYAVSKRPEVLVAAEGLSGYLLTEMKPDSFQGAWSSELGTWVVAPSQLDVFEHFEGVKVCDVGWGYNVIEGIDYLTQLAAATKNEKIKASIPEKCVSAMKWQYDTCQFEDGAVGISSRDDKWVGMTAGAVLSFLRNRDAGFLSEEDIAVYRPKARAAVRWVLKHITPETLQTGGYFRVSGKSTLGPRDCRVWHLAWALDALFRMPEI